MKRIHVLLPAICMCMTLTAFAQEQSHNTGELTSEVPALADMHEVIMPLWHDAWPAKNYALMKELLPKVEHHLQQVSSAQLPGILRDRKAKWETGVAALAASVDEYKNAASTDNQQGLLDAVEKLHTNYEKMVRVIRPRMKELEAYHQDLYQVFHYHLPNRDLEQLRLATAGMVKSAGELAGAATPKRLEKKEDAFKSAVKSLHEGTLALERAAKGDDWTLIGKCVDDVHTAYQSIDAMFD